MALYLRYDCICEYSIALVMCLFCGLRAKMRVGVAAAGVSLLLIRFCCSLFILFIGIVSFVIVVGICGIVRGFYACCLLLLLISSIIMFASFAIRMYHHEASPTGSNASNNFIFQTRPHMLFSSWRCVYS